MTLFGFFNPRDYSQTVVHVYYTVFPPSRPVRVYIYVNLLRATLLSPRHASRSLALLCPKTSARICFAVYQRLPSSAFPKTRVYSRTKGSLAEKRRLGRAPYLTDAAAGVPFITIIAENTWGALGPALLFYSLTFFTRSLARGEMQKPPGFSARARFPFRSRCSVSPRGCSIHASRPIVFFIPIGMSLVIG